ncbi:substrate-binding domain-containing protein [Amnibacterium kyonggiense]|uniref:LacI family transcriptional regulator n=1 Tax=Amnibacterium kyonggiense TaxID=595671 RepID=A0A4R7FS28_9MICO|nr:substrate-binding domain-containing protein [Amnibacterium kyonggiense]TDS80620.1 LacI family transcriptional regulator [Amnibacterium kyonggiense]
MPNIFDVAKAAGVSHQTVSRVLNGDPTVRPAVRERVDEAIVALDYRPSAAARALARRSTRTIGLVVVGMQYFGPGSIANGFNAAARASGWDVAIAATDDGAAEDDVRQAGESLLAQDPRAVVVIAPGPAVGAALAGLAQRVPVVTTVDVVPGAAAVSIDDVRAAELAVEHLAALGHRSVLHLAGPEGWTEADERIAGWRSASERLGLEAPEVVRGDWSSASGYRVGRRIAAEGVPTAVFSANDQMALGLLAAFRDAGVRVPDDVSVVGFDDIPEAAFFAPPLTTLRQDFVALGHGLMARVEGLLARQDVPPASPLVPELIVRASTAPPR